MEKLFPNLPPSEELPERMAVLKHLNPQARVLEIGANKGGVSSLIASVLETSTNLVAVEPILSTCQGLEDLGKQMGKPFNVFCGVLRGKSSSFVECSGQKDSYAKCIPSTELSKTENLTLDQLEIKYGLTFDTIVIDCEGCYSSFLQDILDRKSIQQIQIEWDGPFQEKQIIENGFKLIAKYNHHILPMGVRVYERI